MANEIHKHLDLCVERNEDFLGRDVDLYKVQISNKSLLQHFDQGMSLIFLLFRITMHFYLQFSG